jgi:hypothetical protein
MHPDSEPVLRYRIRLKLSIPDRVYITRDRFARVAIDTFRMAVRRVSFLDDLRWRPDGKRATRADPYTRRDSKARENEQ